LHQFVEVLDHLLLLPHHVSHFGAALLVVWCARQHLLPLVVVETLLLNLPLELAVLFFECVDALREDVDVVVQRVVLLLRLDEGVGDLLKVGDAAALADLLEGLLNLLDRALVLFDGPHLLFVLRDQLLQPYLQHRLRVDRLRFLRFVLEFSRLADPLLLEIVLLQHLELLDRIGAVLGVALANRDDVILEYLRPLFSMVAAAGTSPRWPPAADCSPIRPAGSAPPDCCKFP